MKKRNTGFWFKPLLLGVMIGSLSLVGCNSDSSSDESTSNSTTDVATNIQEREKVLEPGTICLNGGATIESGIDINGNGLLDDEEVTKTDNICNGVNGADTAKMLQPESCAICHSDAGSMHQAVYDDYADASAFAVTINSVVSDANADDPATVDVDESTTFTSTMTFTIMKDGMAYVDTDLSGLSQKRYYASTYDSATGKFNVAFSYGSPTSRGGGVYTVVQANASFAPETSNAQVYAYVGDDALETEGMTLYADVTNAGKAYGNAGTYVSAANVEACESCHGTPYMKHGYRAAEVAGLADFAACKSCHTDARDGGHEDWQILADNPARYAELHAGADMTAEEEAKYAYKRSLMNDVHMSHNMEFPYPQSMANCATCHEGKLDSVLTDANFKVETCQSCHAVDGLLAILPPGVHGSITTANLQSTNCNACHTATNPVLPGPVFSQIHTGYNKDIYSDAAGTKYSEVFTVTVDNVSVDENNLMTINFSATKDPADTTTTLTADMIVPTVMVGLYGYDTKDYIVSPHGRTIDSDRDAEYVVGSESTRFTTVTAADGIWEVTADLSAWADMITDGSVKRAEIGVLPKLGVVVGEVDVRGGESDDIVYALDAPSKTFNFGANAFEDFFDDIVKVDGGCNNCHDALATTFHTGDRGGNIKVCRMCHTTASGGSHLEMQSRSIDSYVHAIHSFQAFDPGDVDFSDAVEALEYDLHVEHTYPNFTIKNCESCHNEGTYEVPDQSMSMPGKFSRADTFVGRDRSIGAVPSYVAGPASRACGSCHRADMINEDDAGKLAAFNQHTTTFGYLVEDEGDVSVWSNVVSEIMYLFK